MARINLLEKSPSKEKKDEIRTEVFKTSIQTMTPEELQDFVSDRERKLNMDVRGDKCIGLTNCFHQFFATNDLDTNGFPVTIDLEKLAEQHRRTQMLYIELFQHIRREDMSSLVSRDINGDEMRLIDRVNRLIQAHSDAYDQVLLYERQMNRINNPALLQEDNLFRCSTFDGDADADDVNPFQKLLLFLLNTTDRLGMRRYKGYCCQQIGQTRAWKPMISISDFVYQYTQKETKYDMWKNITSKGTIVKDTIRHLNDCYDVQFPSIQKNRNVWSFENGLFVAKKWDQDTAQYVAKFYPYESNDFKILDPTITSCKYFDQQFTWYECPWWDIPTPYMQSILDYQKFPREVSEWMYVFAGRLMFNVGDMDQWQVIPFLKGIARSGKSTLITKVFKKFYDSEDVRTLSNNIERKFGLSSIYDGFMFISPEVKGDLCLEQAEFQSLVSGEDISIARKNEKALSLTWQTPGILAGNEVPGWKDNSGSVLRRIVTFDFKKQVQDADPKLEDKLHEEIPTIMLKCALAYLEFSKRYADKDIWTVLPPYFKTVQNQVAMVTNSLHHFLSSEKVTFGADLKCPQKAFIQLFNSHCTENNLGRFKFNPDFYAGPFSSRDITVATETLSWNGKIYANQAIICGLDLQKDTAEFSDDY
jgi:hypothetical protein